MKRYNFAGSSIDRLAEADKRLRDLFMEVKRVANIDFDISCTHRSEADQLILFHEGKSKVRKSKHNYYPSRAIDVYCYKENGKPSWQKEQYIYLAGIVQAVAHSQAVNIRWGGNWDGDGEVVTDQDFDDLCHFELQE